MDTNSTTHVIAPELGTIASDVLGDLAFLISDDVPSTPPADAPWLRCTVRYMGPVRGELTCWATPEFAVQLCANLLGLDPRDPDSAKSADDALGELMNVVAGQAVTAWYGKKAVFNLSIPQVESILEMPRPENSDFVLSVNSAPVIFRHERITGDAEN